MEPALFFLWSFCHDLSTSIPTLRAEVDGLIRILNDIEVMFDHYHGVAGFDKPIEHVATIRLSPCSDPRSLAVCGMACRLFRKAVQQGRSERRGEAYASVR